MPSFSGDSATNAANTTSNPQDNNDIFGTLTLEVATHFVISSAQTSVTVFTQWSFTITAEDASNQVVPGYAGTLNLTSTEDPNLVYSAGNPVSLPMTMDIYDVSPKKSGVFTLTATDPVTGITGTSNDITATPAAASRFEVDAPSTATQGVAFNFTVTAIDLFNNTVTGYNGSVTFSSTAGSAVLPGPQTLTSGVGSFTATLNSPGEQTITASDIANDFSGTSNDIDVTDVAPATITASFSPSTVEVGGDSIFTITITNPNTVPLTHVQFSNVVPAGITLITQTGGTARDRNRNWRRQ